MYLNPDQLIAHYEKCKSGRTNFENIWQKIGDYIVPLKSDIQTTHAPGDSRYNQVFDSTAMVSCELLASTLHSMLTSPTSYFFSLTTGVPKLDAMDDVRKWIEGTVRDMHDLLNNTNFQTEVHEYYIDLCGFGNGSLFIEEDDNDIVRFQSRPLKEIYVKENSKGKVDTLYRCFKLSAKDIYAEFDGNKDFPIPQKIQDAFKAGKTDEFEIIHSIYPRGYSADTLDSKFPFISQYILKQDKTNLLIKGFREFPTVFGRWSKISGEDYGRGPGERALPDTLTLNEMTRVTLVGAQKVIDPPLQMPDDGFIMPINTRPGGFAYYRAGSPATDRISPIFNDSRIDFGFQSIDRKTVSIKDAFYVNQLQLRDGPQMTATEVQQRTEQALRFLGPMLGRQQSEFLAPLVGRVYGIMARRQKIAPVPASIQNVPLKVQYSSIMAVAQRQSEMQNIGRTIQGIAPLVSFAPDVTDFIDADATAKRIARLSNYPQDCIRDQKDIAGIRQQRQQAQQQQQAAATAQQGADTVNSIATASKAAQPA